MGAMQYLRDPRKLKIGMALIMILVIPSFVLFYGFGGSNQGGGAGIVDRPIATVKTSGGERQVMGSQTREFRETMARRFMGVYQSQFQQPPDQRTMAQISSGISNKEIAEYAAGQLVVEELADRYQVAITPRQVAEDLKAQGITGNVLTQILQQRRQREVDFVAEQQRAMRGQRAADILTSAARVSLPELWQEYAMNNSKVAVEYVNLQLFDLEASIEVADEDVEKWFNENSNRYIQPEQRIYRYVSVAPPEVDIPLEPVEEEILARYESIDHHEDARLALPQGIEVRQIVISTESRDEAAAKELATKVSERLAAGEDFAALANEFSEDIHNIRFDDESDPAYNPPSLAGGVLPQRLTADNESIWRGEYGAEWADAVKSLQPGDAPQIVAVDNGVAIVRVDSIEEGGKRPLDEVREMLRREIRTERTVERRTIQTDMINEMEPRMREAVAQSSSLEPVAEAVGAEVAESVPVDIQTYSLPGVGSLFAHRELLAKLEPGELSPVMRTGSNPPTLVVLQVKEVLPERPQTFEEAKDRATRDLKAQRAQDRIGELTEQIRGLVADGKSLREAAEEAGVADKFTTVEEPFLLSQPPPGLIGMPDAQREFASKAVRAKVGDVFPVESKIPSSDQVFSTAIVQITDRQAPDRAAFVEEVNRFERGLMMVKMETVLNAYKNEALERLNVTYDEDYIREADPRRRREGRS